MRHGATHAHAVHLRHHLHGHRPALLAPGGAAFGHDNVAMEDHPWNVRHPIVAGTTRLREVLGALEPDPLEATVAQIDWLWEQREALGG